MIPFDKMTNQQSKYFAFGDQRLDVRAAKVLATLVKSQCWEGFPCIFKDQYQLKAFYRLMNNRRVTPGKVIEGYTAGLNAFLREQASNADVTGQVYYQYQDTTYGSYLHRAKLDLGYLENVDDNGVVIHTALLTNHLFTPIGIAWQKQILRDREDYQKARERKKRPFEEKESYKWVEAMEWSVAIQKELKVQIIHVADREGDMNDLFNYAFEHDLKFIVRARHDRMLPEEKETHKLWTYLRAQPAKAIIKRQLLDEDGKVYTARCAIYWDTIQLKNNTKPIQVVYLRQLDNIKKEQAAEWAIYTNLAVEQKEQAIEIFDVYTHRWRTCEDFHKCLKTGCSMEKRQFESAHALTNCIAILSLTAIHLLRIRHLATLDQQPIDQILNEQEIRLAQILAQRHLKPIDLTISQPKTVLWLALLLGRMGGHQGVRQKGLPGWRTLWLGWYDFQKLMDGIILSKNFL
jgi:hypothetical protein